MSDYWLDRVRRIQDKKDEIAKTADQELEKIYKRYSRSIQTEIDGFYTRYAGREGLTKQEAVKLANAFDVEAFADKARHYVEEKDFSPQANAELALYNLEMKVNRLELLKLHVDLEAIALGNEEDAYIRQNKLQAHYDEMVRQSGILSLSLPNRQEVRKLAETVLYTPYHGKDFSDRVWERNGDLRTFLSNELGRAVNQGKNPRKLAKQLRDEFEVTRHEAYRLAVTEYAYIQSEARRQAFEESDWEQYDIATEATACHHCRDVADAGPYYVKDMQPGVNASALHPHCKCTEVPHAGRERLERMFKAYEDGDYEKVLKM